MNSKLVKRIEALSAAFQGGRLFSLKRIGEDSIRDAVLGNDSGFAQASVISYALYKMLSKKKFTQNRRWGTVTKIISQSLEKSSEALRKNDSRDFRRHMESAVNEIKAIDDELSNYVKNVFEKARIKQASTAYALGMSIGKSAELTQANKVDLQKYIGYTRIHDEQEAGRSLSDRLKNLKAELGK